MESTTTNHDGLIEQTKCSLFDAERIGKARKEHACIADRDITCYENRLTKSSGRVDAHVEAAASAQRK